VTNGGRAPRVQSVDRALQVLEAVGSHPDGLAAKEVARRLGLTLPTTYHLLTTLADAGYVAHLPVEHRYALGNRIRELEVQLCRQLAVPDGIAIIVRELRDRADAAAYYAVYRSDEVVVSHVEDSARRPRMTPLGVGFHEAPHATAFGKVMLAAMAPAARRALLETLPRLQLTRRTITDPTMLESHLRHVRDSRVALEIEEFQPGWACLASSVHAPAGAVVAAVAVSVPAREFPKRRWAIEHAVRRSAALATRALVDLAG